MMERLNKLAAMARKLGCDGVLITEGENLCYATGFVGLEGMVLVTADGKGYCFTDSRYIEAAEKAIAPWGYQVIQPDVSYPQCVAQLCSEHKLESLLFEDQAMTVSTHARYTAAVPAKLVAAGEAFSELREVKHLTFEDQEYGPKFAPLAKLLAERGLTPRIICESAGTQAEDAAVMKQEYLLFLK